MVSRARKAREGTYGPNVGRLSATQTVGCFRPCGLCANQTHKRTDHLVAWTAPQASRGSACTGRLRARGAWGHGESVGRSRAPQVVGAAPCGCLPIQVAPAAERSLHAHGMMVAALLPRRTGRLASCSFLGAALCVRAFCSISTPQGSNLCSRARGCSQQTETRTPPRRYSCRTTAPAA